MNAIAPLATRGEQSCPWFSTLRILARRVMTRATPAIKEAGLSIACCTLCAPFAEDKVVVAILFSAIPVQLTISGLARKWLAKVERQPRKIYQREIARWIEPIPRVVWPIGHVALMWHMLGIFIGSQIVYQGHQPAFNIEGPLEGGVLMKGCNTHLTSFGHSLGVDGAIAWSVAGGTVFSVVGSWTSLSFGILKKSRTLVLVGAMESLRELVSAFESLAPSSCENDLNKNAFEKLGVPQGAMIAVIAGVPLLICALPKIKCRRG